MTNPLVAVDLSHFQATPDWADLQLEGIVGVILKASEGSTYVDPTFHDRYREAKASGLKVATYHFLKAGGDIEDQIEWYLDTVDPEPGERVVIDFEDKGLTRGDLLSAVQALVNYDENLQITVYGSSSFLRETVGDEPASLLAGTSLWVASYTTAANPSSFPKVWKTWSLWQYTDAAKINGWGPVDGNRFNGSVESCAAWFGPAAVQPAPAPEPPAPKPEPVPTPVPTPVPVPEPEEDAVVEITVTITVRGGTVTISTGAN